MKKTIRIFLPVLAVAILNGCASYKSVEPPTIGPGPKPYLVGETVRVKTHDGQVFEEQLTHIDPDSLVVSEIRVFFKDIETFEIKQKSTAAKAMHGTVEATFELLTLAAFLYGFQIIADLAE